MMNVFNGMVKKMKDGGGVSFDFDLTQGGEEALPTTLERIDNEESDGVCVMLHSPLPPNSAAPTENFECC
jgi:hypothetical protein